MIFKIYDKKGITLMAKNYYSHVLPLESFHVIYEKDMRLVDAGIITKDEAELLSYIRGWGQATFSLDYVACVLRVTKEAIQDGLLQLTDLSLIRITGMSPYGTPIYEATDESPVDVDEVTAKPIEKTSGEFDESQQQAVFEMYNKMQFELKQAFIEYQMRFEKN